MAKAKKKAKRTLAARKRVARRNYSIVDPPGEVRNPKRNPKRKKRVRNLSPNAHLQRAAKALRAYRGETHVGSKAYERGRLDAHATSVMADSRATALQKRRANHLIASAISTKKNPFFKQGIVESEDIRLYRPNPTLYSVFERDSHGRPKGWRSSHRSLKAAKRALSRYAHGVIERSTESKALAKKLTKKNPRFENDSLNRDVQKHSLRSLYDDANRESLLLTTANLRNRNPKKRKEAKGTNPAHFPRTKAGRKGVKKHFTAKLYTAGNKYHSSVTLHCSEAAANRRAIGYMNNIRGGKRITKVILSDAKG